MKQIIEFDNATATRGREMQLQTFNIRNRHSNWFLGTIQLFSRTNQDETAQRLQRYIERRHKKLVLVCPVI